MTLVHFRFYPVQYVIRPDDSRFEALPDKLLPALWSQADPVVALPSRQKQKTRIRSIVTF